MQTNEKKFALLWATNEINFDPKVNTQNIFYANRNTASPSMTSFCLLLRINYYRTGNILRAKKGWSN